MASNNSLGNPFVSKLMEDDEDTLSLDSNTSRDFIN